MGRFSHVAKNSSRRMSCLVRGSSMIFNTCIDKWEIMASNASLEHADLSEVGERAMDHYSRFINSPESFLLNVPTKEHTPHEENIGDYGWLICDGYIEVGLVGLQARVRTRTSDIHKEI